MSRHKTNRLGPPLGEGAGRVADRLGAREPRSGSAGGIRVSSLPTWAIWSIAAAALLSPVLAFLIAIAVEILIGSLTDAGVPLASPDPRRRWRPRLGPTSHAVASPPR